MVKQILEMLALDKHYSKSENIEIAKGKYAIRGSIREKVEQINRKSKMKWQQR